MQGKSMQGKPSGTLAEIAITLSILVLLFSFWRLTLRPIHVTVDGIGETVYTHRATIDDLVTDLGLLLHPNDRINPPIDSRLIRNMQVTIERASPVRILVDGRDIQAASWGQTLQDAFHDAGITIDQYDQILLNGEPADLKSELPKQATVIQETAYAPTHEWENIQLEPPQLRVYRAVPIVVDEGEIPFTVRTTAQTVGEALRRAEITLYLGDQVQPSLGSRVTTGMQVTIQRSTPISLRTGERHIKTRVRSAETIADALSSMGVNVSGMDRVEPPLETPLYDNIEIAIVRTHEEVEIEEDILQFETVFAADQTLRIDTQEVTNPGAPGITRWRYRTRYEDGEEMERVLEDTWVAQDPENRVIGYGQKIEPNTFTTPSGEQITYWRKIRMYASSYSAGTAGVSPDVPWYGRTFTGERMRFGIVAVDPSIIPLRSRVYVPGYGYGDALDIGSAVRSKRIDLGYDDSNLVLWSQWVDVYLLWPPPPNNQITWVLPQWPNE